MDWTEEETAILIEGAMAGLDDAEIDARLPAPRGWEAVAAQRESIHCLLHGVSESFWPSHVVRGWLIAAGTYRCPRMGCTEEIVALV